MSTFKTTKNTKQDWHPADIVAALHKKGWSLRQLSLQCNYSAGALKKALHVSWPKAERIIATALDLEPEDIWPERCAKRNFVPTLPRTLRDIGPERKAA